LTHYTVKREAVVAVFCLDHVKENEARAVSRNIGIMITNVYRKGNNLTKVKLGVFPYGYAPGGAVV